MNNGQPVESSTVVILTVYGEFSEIEYHQINHGQTMEHSTTMVPIDSISKTLFFLNLNYKKEAKVNIRKHHGVGDIREHRGAAKGPRESF